MGRSHPHLVTGKILFVVIPLLVLRGVFPWSLWAQATLDNPQPGSAQSGIGVISGWACQATRVDIEIDGVAIQAAYGTSRADTSSACGQQAGGPNNGFGLLFNWNLLPPGPHTVSALADGNKFAEVKITVANFGTEFLTGKSGEFTLD